MPTVKFDYHVDGYLGELTYTITADIFPPNPTVGILGWEAEITDMGGLRGVEVQEYIELTERAIIAYFEILMEGEEDV